MEFWEEVLNMTGTCPVCDAGLELPENTQETEIVACKDCKSKLEVSKVENKQAVLVEAPEVEEDWGQ